VIAYPAMLDVPRELVTFVATQLRAERRRRGTRAASRALTCWNQAVFALAWFRNRDDLALLGAGFAISRATAYRYRDEAVDVLALQAPDLHQALQRVAAEGWSHVILDGKVFATDRVAETTLSVKGKTIHAWYSGKLHDFGGNIQAIMRPDGLPIWTSEVAPGHLHDLTVAAETDVLGALYWAAAHLNLPTLADAGYDGAGQGIHTPIKQPAGGNTLDPDNRTYNQTLRALRAPGERGFALLTQRWRALQHITACPQKAGDLTKAALVLTHFEHRYLPNSC
jgi:hypothetical protein